MTDFNYLKPCLEFGPACSLDWAGVAALGSLAAALATYAAVRVALRAAKSQSEVAAAAVAAERAKAEHIQEREWRATNEAHRKVAKQLAHAIGRELAYARRQLVPVLCYWSPFSKGKIPDALIESYGNKKPLNDLVLLRSCTDKLQGFNDEDALELLTLLATWQFFNGHPGIRADELRRKADEDWKELVRPRVSFGLELLDMVESAIERLEQFQDGKAPMTRVELESLPIRLETRLKVLRARMKED